MWVAILANVRRLPLVLLLLGCASPSPHEVLWGARLEVHEHKQECGEGLHDSHLAVPYLTYECPDEADALLPVMRRYTECLARRAARYRDCVVWTCDPDAWDECNSGSSCEEPSMDDMQTWNCAVNMCGVGGDPQTCLDR